MKKPYLLLLAIALLVGRIPALAAVPPDPGAETIVHADHVTTIFGNLHNRLQEKFGLSFEIFYLQDMFWNTRGGIKTGDSGEYPRLMGLQVELATARAGLWENGAFFLSLEHFSGHSPGGRSVGDWQGLDNIDAARFNQVAEFWYRHGFFDDRLWLKLGKMEANADFSCIETGLEFIHSSAGLIPTVPLPSYPDQDWGAVVGIKPAAWFGCNLGIYQGQINGRRSVGHTIDQLRGPLLIAEPSFAYTAGGLPGSAHIGAWWNGRDFDAFHRHDQQHKTHGKAWGWYGFWEQLLWKENAAAPDDGQGIGLFVQYGWAPGDRFQIEDYVGAGMRWQGSIPDRDADVLGLGAFTVFFSGRADFREHTETAVELFYKARLFGWLALQPDLQYITNPGGNTEKNALVLGGRIEFVF